MSDSRSLEAGFNVRVYGVWTHERCVLLSEERHKGQRLVKFPGGGLHVGEGPVEGLRREFREELACEIYIGPFFYVSPHFHRSYFRPMQLISLYWQVTAPVVFAGQSEFHAIPGAEEGHFQRLFWHGMDTELVSSLTTDVDREVAEKLLSTPSLVDTSDSGGPN